MALSFNPKMLAYDIAKGMVYFSPANLKKYSPQDLKNILSHLNLVQREVRAKQIPQEEVMKIKEKNQQLQRLNQAMTTINSYVKQRRIQL
jgi:hypothetical protein